MKTGTADVGRNPRPEYNDETLHKLIATRLSDDPNFMPQTLAGELGVPLGRVIAALPETMRSHTSGSRFSEIWEVMTGWEKVTFMAVTPGAILEISCRLPKGKPGHGMYNLMDTSNPLRGHLLADNIASVWFVSKPVFGLESHSVQFLDAEGNQCFAVYLGRDENRRILESVKDGFLALKARYETEEEAA